MKKNMSYVDQGQFQVRSRKFGLAEKEFRIEWDRPGSIELSQDEKPLVHKNLFVVAGVGRGGPVRGRVGLFDCERFQSRGGRNTGDDIKSGAIGRGANTGIHRRRRIC